MSKKQNMMTRQSSESQLKYKDATVEDVIKYVTSASFCRVPWDSVTMHVSKGHTPNSDGKKSIVHIHRATAGKRNIFDIKFHNCHTKTCEHTVCSDKCFKFNNSFKSKVLKNESNPTTTSISKSEEHLNKKPLIKTKPVSSNSLTTAYNNFIEKVKFSPNRKCTTTSSSSDSKEKNYYEKFNSIFRKISPLQSSEKSMSSDGITPQQIVDPIFKNINKRNTGNKKNTNIIDKEEKPSCTLHLVDNGRNRALQFNLHPALEVFLLKAINKIEERSKVNLTKNKNLKNIKKNNNTKHSLKEKDNNKKNYTKKMSESDVEHFFQGSEELDEADIKSFSEESNYSSECHKIHKKCNKSNNCENNKKLNVIDTEADLSKESTGRSYLEFSDSTKSNLDNKVHPHESKNYQVEINDEAEYEKPISKDKCINEVTCKSRSTKSEIVSSRSNKSINETKKNDVEISRSNRSITKIRSSIETSGSSRSINETKGSDVEISRSNRCDKEISTKNINDKENNRSSSETSTSNINDNDKNRSSSETSTSNINDNDKNRSSSETSTSNIIDNDKNRSSSETSTSNIIDNEKSESGSETDDDVGSDHETYEPNKNINQTSLSVKINKNNSISYTDINEKTSSTSDTNTEDEPIAEGYKSNRNEIDTNKQNKFVRCTCEKNTTNKTDFDTKPVKETTQSNSSMKVLTSVKESKEETSVSSSKKTDAHQSSSETSCTHEKCFKEVDIKSSKEILNKITSSCCKCNHNETSETQEVSQSSHSDYKNYNKTWLKNYVPPYSSKILESENDSMTRANDHNNRYQNYHIKYNLSASPISSRHNINNQTSHHNDILYNQKTSFTPHYHHSEINHEKYSFEKNVNIYPLISKCDNLINSNYQHLNGNSYEKNTYPKYTNLLRDNTMSSTNYQHLYDNNNNNELRYKNTTKVSNFYDCLNDYEMIRKNHFRNHTKTGFLTIKTTPSNFNIPEEISHLNKKSINNFDKYKYLERGDAYYNTNLLSQKNFKYPFFKESIPSSSYIDNSSYSMINQKHDEKEMTNIFHQASSSSKYQMYNIDPTANITSTSSINLFYPNKFNINNELNNKTYKSILKGKDNDNNNNNNKFLNKDNDRRFDHHVRFVDSNLILKNNSIVDEIEKSFSVPNIDENIQNINDKFTYFNKLKREILYQDDVSRSETSLRKNTIEDNLNNNMYTNNISKYNSIKDHLSTNSQNCTIKNDDVIQLNNENEKKLINLKKGIEESMNHTDHKSSSHVLQNEKKLLNINKLIEKENKLKCPENNHKKKRNILNNLIDERLKEETIEEIDNDEEDIVIIIEEEDKENINNKHKNKKKNIIKKDKTFAKHSNNKKMYTYGIDNAEYVDKSSEKPLFLLNSSEIHQNKNIDSDNETILSKLSFLEAQEFLNSDLSESDNDLSKNWMTRKYKIKDTKKIKIINKNKKDKNKSFDDFDKILSAFSDECSLSRTMAGDENQKVNHNVQSKKTNLMKGTKPIKETIAFNIESNNEEIINKKKINNKQDINEKDLKFSGTIKTNNVSNFKCIVPKKLPSVEMGDSNNIESENINKNSIEIVSKFQGTKSEIVPCEVSLRRKSSDLFIIKDFDVKPISKNLEKRFSDIFLNEKPNISNQKKIDKVLKRKEKLKEKSEEINCKENSSHPLSYSEKKKYIQEILKKAEDFKKFGNKKLQYDASFTGDHEESEVRRSAVDLDPKERKPKGDHEEDVAESRRKLRERKFKQRQLRREMRQADEVNKSRREMKQSDEMKESRRELRQSGEVKESRRELRQSGEMKESRRELRQSGEVKESRRELRQSVWRRDSSPQLRHRSQTKCVGESISVALQPATNGWFQDPTLNPQSGFSPNMSHL